MLLDIDQTSPAFQSFCIRCMYLETDDSCLLGCNAVFLTEQFQMFQRINLTSLTDIYIVLCLRYFVACRPGMVYTLQALSEDDRKCWMDVMDGKEPVSEDSQQHVVCSFLIHYQQAGTSLPCS